MRAHQKRLESRVASSAAPDKIARGVDRDLEPRAAHQSHRVLSPLPIGFAEGDSAHAALRVLTELRERGEMLDDAICIHSQPRLRLPPRQRKQRNRAHQMLIEIATIHRGLTVM